MENLTGKHSAFAPLTKYSFRQRLTIRAADVAGYALTMLLGSLTRFTVEGWEHFESASSDGKQPVMVFWHDRILLATYYFRRRGIHVLSSMSFDGEYVARFIQRLGFGAIRGSSSRGGSAALVEMIRYARRGAPVGFTLDGPRGPRYQAKMGPILVAKKTGHPILPFIVEAKRYWTIGSWDRLQIPWPLTRARIIIAPPIYVDVRARQDVMDQTMAEMQKALDDLVAAGERWRLGL